MPLPPPDPSKRRGRRSVHGAVPPLPSIRDLMVLTDPEAADVAPEIPVPPPDPSALTPGEQVEFQDVLAEIGTRRCEALRLFEPMPEQERFFASEAGERIALGANRGGKTTVTCVEIARAATGQDPHDKYPKEGLRIILVGKDLTHCAKVFYRKLFKPGAFKIIRDEETGQWRAFRPSDPADAARATAAKNAPPLISSRFYDPNKVSWENKREQVPKTIYLRNGTEIYFFSSIAQPPQGWDVDLVVFDEEIEGTAWYPEMAARLLDRRQFDPATGRFKSGRFAWSATPQAGTQQLYDLACKADQQCQDVAEALERGEPAPAITVAKFHFGLFQNSFMSEHAKADLVQKFSQNEDEYRVRILGDFALLGMRVYPEFTPRGVHGIDPFPIPDDWTRYIAVDPGRQVCAVLFVAIPPPAHALAGHKILYDELYIKRCNAAIFAERLKGRVGESPLHAGVLDHRAGRITEIGSGLTHEEQYVKALRKLGFQFEAGGAATFRWSNDDVKAGIEAVRRGLHVADGSSEWLVMRQKCPNFLWEAERYSYRKLPGGVVTDEPVKVNDHLMDCWRYLAMENLRYVPPKKKNRKLGYTSEILKRKAAKARRKSGWGTSIKVG